MDKKPIADPKLTTRTILTMLEVSTRLGIGRHTIAKMVKDGKFPKPFKPTDWRNYFVLSDIEKWERGEFKND